MSATIPDLNRPCPNCDHQLKFHDPEDGSCDVFSGDYKIGVCPCGRPSKSSARRLPDDQVAWYAGTSRTAKWSPHMSVHENIVTLAREVQERRAADTRTPSFTDDEKRALGLNIHARLARAGLHPNQLQPYWVPDTDSMCYPKDDPETITAAFTFVREMFEMATGWRVLGDPSPAPPALRWVLCGDHRQIMYDTGEYLVGSVPCPSCGGEK